MFAETSTWAHNGHIPNHGSNWDHDFVLYELYVQTLVQLHAFGQDLIYVTVGIGLHIQNSSKIWRIPFAFQLVPAGIMALGLLTIRESPRWLASKGRSADALANLAYLRKRSPNSPDVLHELAEIEAALAEEREARTNFGLREAFFGRGNSVRFLIAFSIFFLQNWSGQISISFYAPQIFTSVRKTIRPLSQFIVLHPRLATRVPVARFWRQASMA
jgi:hypothetical protein